MEDKSYFKWDKCKNCGANILSNSNKCGYCETPYANKYSFTDEQLTFLKEYAENLKSELYRKEGIEFYLFYIIFGLILSSLLGWGFHYLTKDLYASISLAIVSIFPIQFYYYYKHEKNDLYPDKLNNFRRKVLIPRIEKDLGAKGMDFNHFQEYLYIHLKDEKYFSHSKLVDFLYERKI